MMTWTADQEAFLNVLERTNWQRIALIAPAGTGKTTVLEEFARRLGRAAPVLFLVSTHQTKALVQDHLPAPIAVKTFADLAHESFPGSDEVSSWNLPQLRQVIAPQIDQFGTLYADDVQQWIREYCLVPGDEPWSTWAQTKAQAFDGPSVHERLTALISDGQALWDACETQTLPYLSEMLLKRFVHQHPVHDIPFIIVDEAENAGVIFKQWLAMQTAREILAADPTGIESKDPTEPSLLLNLPADHVFTLDASFRLADGAAERATRIMNWRTNRPTLKGLGACEVKVQDSIVGRRPLTLIARYNMSLLEKMIDISMAYHSTFLYFYWDASGLWQDVNSAYRLWARERGFSWTWHGERWTNYHEWLQKMTTAKNSEAMTLASLIKKHGRRLPVIMQQVQNQIVDTIEPTTVVLTTAENARGREWDMVQILDDFIPLPQLSLAYKTRRQTRQHALSAPHAAYEVQLLYLAMTRARRTLWIPSSVDTWLHPTWQTFFDNVLSTQQRALWNLHENYEQTAEQVVQGGKWTADELARAWALMQEHWSHWSGGQPWPGHEIWE
ncbi:MAG: hypothetical protein OWR62_15900 [Sulfobacillus thermotolerans]|nr:hypothetical protein [Sulfobacillus thermotolerans]